ncbi:MAG: hypothetical protein JST00_17490 [Deltaproteobacteria bacterium]|nr:hypothetical protein [Deltaproteobacteria bacterium]
MRRPRALSVPSAAPAPAPAPSGVTVVQASDKTVREVIPPWHVIQQKMAAKKKESEERAALETITPPPPAPEAMLALSAFEEAPPPSGVRLSDPATPVAEPIALSDDDLAVEEAPALSFKVYTLAELERRSDAPVSMRASRVFESSMARNAQHALRAKNAVIAFFKAAFAWWRTPKMEREPAKLALRQPFDVMGDELELVVRALDWKKAGVYTGIAVGASLTLLFTVLTAAELTDDLHTTGKASMNLQPSSAVSPPLAAAPLAAAPVPPVPAAVAPAAPAAAEEVTEIDPPPAAPKKVASAPAPRKPAPAAAKKKLAFRSADDVFKP